MQYVTNVWFTHQSVVLQNAFQWPAHLLLSVVSESSDMVPPWSDSVSAVTSGERLKERCLTLRLLEDGEPVLEKEQFWGTAFANLLARNHNSLLDKSTQINLKLCDTDQVHVEIEMYDKE